MIKYLIIFIIALSIILFLFFTNLSNNKESWTNWGHNVTCVPYRILKPKFKEDLITIIQDTYIQKKPIHAVGSGHSWSNIVCTEGYLIDLVELNRVIAIDKKNKIAHVEAGITIKELNKQLHEIGLALPNQGAVMAQTIAGITATATHGSGKTGSFSSFIKEVELITVSGNIVRINAEEPELFAAACTHMGCLGIVYSMKIQCIDEFRVSHKSYDMPLEELLKDYDQLRKDHDFFSFTYMPNTDTAHITIRDKTKNATGEFSYLALSSIEDEIPGNRLEEEIGIPIEKLSMALKLLKPIIVKYRNNDEGPREVLCRFVNAESTYLSPASGRDTVFISISTPPNTDKWLSFFKEFEEALLPLQGRPHWGKINFMDKIKAEELYGNSFVKFNDIRKKLDLDNRLLNSYYQQIFA